MMRLISFVLTLVLMLAAQTPIVRAQEPVIPNFWDPQERMIRPNVRSLPRLRFLTITDFPPFSYIDKDKRLAGFHVELARAICEQLELLRVCQMQALPFNELEPALKANGGDAILAGIAFTPQTSARFSFSRPYFKLPARFVARLDSRLEEPLIRTLAGQDIGVVVDTAHAAYAQANFGDMRVRVFASRDDALAALEKKEIAAVFADALSLASWLQTKRGSDCCGFAGEAYLSERFFGYGLSVALRPEDTELTEAIDYALRQINDRGIFAELYLRYFPIGLF